MMNKNMDKTYLNLKLYPNKSLGIKGLCIVLFIFFILTSVISLYFFSKGAWPVVFFLVLDFFLFYYAFYLYKKKSKEYDLITLREYLVVKKVSTHGKTKEFLIEPTWLRLKIHTSNNSGYLDIISRGKSVRVGKFLTEKEVKSLAYLIKSALIKRESELLSF